jgi:hypothetical protein
LNTRIGPLLSLILCGSLTSCTSVPKKSTEAGTNADAPKILKPEVKKIWIPPEIRNNGTEWVEGHYVYRIEKETTWSR